MVRTTNLVIDIMLPFITNKNLIEGLARSEINSFRNGAHGAQNVEWILKFGETKVTLGGDKYWFYHGQLEKRLSGQNISELPLIGIPGGYLGIQAFYLILENFWRNLVKHDRDKVENKLRNNENLKIYIEIEENPEYTCFWKISLWADVETVKGTAEKIRKILKNEKGSIIDEEGKLIPEGWGTKEMLIGAGYLRGSKLIDLQQKPTEILGCCEKDGKYLCYEFDVLKPMRLFILSDIKIENNIKKALSAKGVWVGSKLEEDYIIPTEYLIGDSKTTSKINDSLKPIKSFEIKDLNINELTDENELNNLLIELEKKFIDCLKGDIENIHFIVRSPNTDDRKLIIENLYNKFNSYKISLSKGEFIKNLRDNKLSENEKKILKQYSNKKTFLVIFDRHGDYYEIVKNYFFNENKNNQLFYEPYEGGSYTAFTLQHVPMDDNEKAHLILRLISSALLKVVILDERLQQILNDTIWTFGSGSVSVSIQALKLLEMMHIYIPRFRDCNLEGPKDTEITRFVEEKKPHILSIHAGILDKMGCKTEDDILRWVESIKNKMDKDIKRVIIHSGRGIPVNVPELKVPFIGYTAIEHWLTSKGLKSKYALVEELLSARGVKR
jgi:hypothetical protein